VWNLEGFDTQIFKIQMRSGEYSKSVTMFLTITTTVYKSEGINTCTDIAILDDEIGGVEMGIYQTPVFFFGVCLFH
jgi:hypothetical protein